MKMNLVGKREFESYINSSKGKVGVRVDRAKMKVNFAGWKRRTKKILFVDPFVEIDTRIKQAESMKYCLAEFMEVLKEDF